VKQPCACGVPLKAGLLALLVLTAALGGCTTTSADAAHRGPTYRNPVFAHDAPDPTILRAPDGMYYAYTTQSIYLNVLEIPILRSPDLVHWRQVGDAFPAAPSWVNGGPVGDMWAPHILYWRRHFLLYYAGRRLCCGDVAIGVGVSASPLGPFRDVGHPILTRSAGQPDYTAIDPFVLGDHGRLYLYWGSDNQPIRVARLSDDGLRVTGKTVALVSPVPARGDYGGLVEAAWVLPHDGFYYLMYSVGDCCSDQANYSVYVSRSRSPLGPFHPDPANPFLHANSHFWAVGHNATVKDAAGHDWVLYHARLRSSPSYDRDLMLDRIIWKKGWPTVNDGKGPTWQPQPAPAAP
jgi:arabinan endo-1,5-alpha-L-arabinosidase